MSKLSTNRLICVILAFAFILRLPLLNQSFWLDEAAQALESARPLAEQLNIVQDFQPPLLHLVVHFAQLLSVDEWWLRLVSALIPALATIYFTLKITRLIAKNETLYTKHLLLIFTGLWLASQSFHIFYSQELRPYSLPALLTSISWYSLLSNRAWPFFLSSTLGLYSSFFYPFVLLGQLIYFWLDRKKTSKKIFAGMITAGLAFLPWLPLLARQLHQGSIVREQLPNWQTAVSIDQLKALPLLLGKWIFGVINLQISITFVLLTLVVVALVLFLALKLFNNKIWRLFFSWSLLPALFSWLISFYLPVFHPKRLLFTLPGLAIFLAWMIAHGYQQKDKLTRKFALILALLLLVINFSGVIQYWTKSELQRENWRGLIVQLENRYAPAETLFVFAFDQPFAPWQWYINANYKTFSLGQYSVSTASGWQRRLEANLLAKPKQVLVFDYLQDLSDPDREILNYLSAHAYQQKDLFTYPLIGFVREYQAVNLE